MLLLTEDLYNLLTSPSYSIESIINKKSPILTGSLTKSWSNCWYTDERHTSTIFYYDVLWYCFHHFSQKKKEENVIIWENMWSCFNMIQNAAIIKRRLSRHGLPLTFNKSLSLPLCIFFSLLTFCPLPPTHTHLFISPVIKVCIIFLFLCNMLP